MPTLLLRLAGPMQSWGVDSRFDVRQTGDEPTKSGVIGLLSAALGYRRDASLDRLSALKFGVRIDNPGIRMCDYQIVQKKAGDPPYVTYRHYLCDAAFLAGIESDDIHFLNKIEYAIKHPVFQIFLGRRSCPPEGRVFWGIRDGALLDVLKSEQPIACVHNSKIRIISDADTFETFGQTVRDVPISFNPKERIFVRRARKLDYAEFDLSVSEHDPMAELE